MIGEKQSQDVSGGSLAVQAKGDAFVHLGLSTSDLRAIVECMADQLPKYVAIAAGIVEERLKTFEEKVVGKFDAELTQHRQAFADPDFQYLLRSSQQTYARSGDEQTCDNLVNLIGERSKIASRDLISLSLNTAVERAGMLSAEAFAALSYAFFWRKVRQIGKTTIGSVANHLLQFADPILGNYILDLAAQVLSNQRGDVSTVALPVTNFELWSLYGRIGPDRDYGKDG